MKALFVFLLLACVGFGVWSGCSLDQVTPNAPAETDVLTTAAGIRAVAVGIQGIYGETVNETIEASAFAAKQFATMPASVLGLREIETGRNNNGLDDVQPGNGTGSNFWSGHYRVVKAAEDLIKNTPNVAIADAGTRSGILALARLMKAMSLGELIETYEQIPVDVTTSQTPMFVSRDVALNTVISLLETARDEITVNPPSADFNTTILGTGFDLMNTIQAMIARYALIKGDYAKALAAANAVDLTKTSSMFYNSTTTRNPFYLNAIQLLYYKPVRTFRLNAETNDRRVAFWVTAGTGNSFLGTPVDEFAQYRTDAAKYYVYLPGEITLIKAEAAARMGDLTTALTHVNTVRTKTTDAAGIGASLPAKTSADLSTQAAMLDEIYIQRYYELFITGLRLGDSRRFGKPGPEAAPAVRTRTLNWFPYPDAERLSNPNTPPSPPM
ncbi:MAG: RagB/SusD family nutrient uptake outer membrane protein [Ignavibacteriae bacterium]|nr:RagB/SusD family nutrient uptake outer membrane protein [Ignavibacteriota bacterium]